jgi:hypothetical protein
MCKSCKFGYILDEETGKCTQNCRKLGFWLDTSDKRNKKCVPCGKGCSQCRGIVCDYCRFGYRRKDGKCFKRSNNLLNYLIIGGLVFLGTIFCCAYLMNERKKRQQRKMREKYKAQLKKRDKVILA